MNIYLLVSMFLWVWWIWLYGSVDITHVNKIYVGDAICDYEGIPYPLHGNLFSIPAKEFLLFPISIYVTLEYFLRSK